jgi:hypothetical protein
MEAITKTFRGLLRSGWGHLVALDANNSVPGVYSKPIYGWYHGDRDVVAMNRLPAIAIDGESISIDWLGLQTQVKEYNFEVLCYVREEDMDISTSYIHEMVRLVESTARELSHWWVFDLCYFDRQYFIDPQYLISNYTAELQPYANQILADDAADWIASHGGGTPAYETPRNKDLFVAAYLKLFEEDPLTDAWATTPFTYTENGITYTTTAGDLIAKARLKHQSPARFVYDFRIKDVSFGFVSRGASLLRAASVRCYAKEVQNITEFGPL